MANYNSRARNRHMGMCQSDNVNKPASKDKNLKAVERAPTIKYHPNMPQSNIDIMVPEEDNDENTSPEQKESVN